MRVLLLLILCAFSSAANDAVVATHYFYWYRWPSQHFRPADQPAAEGHFHHFPIPEQVSYLSDKWHEQQFRDMRAAGIQVALPVYWGAPGAYRRPGIRFSVDGIKPMLRALDRMGNDAVELGLFYDTSTLLNDVRGARPTGGKANLTTTSGKALFSDTIIEYFERIPKHRWARVQGGALVVLYTSAFASKWDTTLGNHVRQAFANRFQNESVFLVADMTWGDVGQDRTTQWGSTLVKPMLHPGVAQIGPGYNDTPVPGRTTPSRERENGNYYRMSWHKAIEHKPELVLIETWNEMHEGTEICETKELGRQYIDLTAKWVKRLRDDAPTGDPIKLNFPKPRYRTDYSWGKNVIGRPQVRADFAADIKEAGLRPARVADGSFRIADDHLISPTRKGNNARYLYFQVSDHWKFEIAPTDLHLTVITRRKVSLNVEFDSHDHTAPVGGAYTRAERIGPASSHIHRFKLRRAMLANRQNGGSDFRIIVFGPDLEIQSVELSKSGRVTRSPATKSRP